ncbi:MAG TPA: hypothetical protein PLB56_11430, partial [Spirochaetales bacterium]|nr:hypothetical protein [Spirochaetales bacterium]
MTPRGLSATDIRRRNRSGILRLIHRHGALARNDLAGALGLTRASVTILSGELLDEGLLEEAGSSGPGGKAGRRKVFLRIRPGAGKLIGAGVEPDRLQVLVTDLAGRVLGVRELPPGDFAGPGAGGHPGPDSREGSRKAEPGARLAEAVLGSASDILGEAGPAAAGVVGAGLGVTGRVDPGTGTCSYPAKAAGTMCRASAGPCDIEEKCDGSGAACPPDVFLQASLICRASAGSCDAAEVCSGTSAACPADSKAADNTT